MAARVRSLCARIVHRHAARALRSWRSRHGTRRGARLLRPALRRTRSWPPSEGCVRRRAGCGPRAQRRALGGVRVKALRRWRERRRASVGRWRQGVCARDVSAKVFAFATVARHRGGGGGRRRLLHAGRRRRCRSEGCVPRSIRGWRRRWILRAAAARLINRALAVFVCRSRACRRWRGSTRRRCGGGGGCCVAQCRDELRAMRRRRVSVGRGEGRADADAARRERRCATAGSALRGSVGGGGGERARRPSGSWGRAAAALAAAGLRQAVLEGGASRRRRRAAKSSDSAAASCRAAPARRALTPVAGRVASDDERRANARRSERGGRARRALRTWAAAAAAARAALTTIGRAVGYALRTLPRAAGGGRG